MSSCKARSPSATSEELGNDHRHLRPLRGHTLGGFADGTFISAERDEDAYTKVSGACGFTSRVRNRNTAGSVTFTLQQTSASNDFMSESALADEAANAGSGPLLIKDLNGRTLISSADAWIRKMPTTQFAKELTNREWVLDTGALPMFVGGNEATRSPGEAA